MFAQNKPKRGTVDRLKYDGPTDVLAWKYPYEDIKLGSQLVVNVAACAALQV
jgi:hypothetical protein